MRYNLIFREICKGIIDIDRYKYTFFSLTVVIIYFLINGFVSFSDNFSLSQKVVNYAFEFNLDRSFIITGLITLLLINFITYFWRKNSRSLRILRRFAIYNFTAQIIYFFLFMIPVGVLMGLEEYTGDFLMHVLGIVIGWPLIAFLVQSSFIAPYRHIKEALSLKTIDVRTSKRLKKLVFLPIIISAVIGIVLGTMPAEKRFSLKFPENSWRYDLTTPVINVASVGPDSLELTFKFLVLSKNEEAIIMSRNQPAFTTKWMEGELDWTISNQHAATLILKKDEPLYLEIKSSADQKSIDDFLKVGIKAYSLNLKSYDRIVYSIYQQE